MNSTTEQWLRQQRRDNPKVDPGDLAKQLAEDPRFARRIYADDLNGLFGRNPVIPMKIKDAVAGLPKSPETLQIRAGIDRLLETARLGGQAGWLATDELEIAAQMRFFAPAVVQAGVLTEDEVTALIGLAGGGVWGDPLPTAEEIAAMFATDDRESSDTALVNKCVNALNAIKDLIRGSDTPPDHAALVKAFEVALG